MKTSSKILISGFLFAVLMSFLYYFNMRLAYQKALANPMAKHVKIDLKEAKYLNINHHWNVNFKQAEKFQIEILKEYKDSLRYNFVADSLNLDATSAGELTIYIPKLPTLKFDSDKGSELKVSFDGPFKLSALDATILKSCYLNITSCQFESVSLKSKEKLNLQIETSTIKSLNLNLPKHSEIELNYSNIIAQNFNLGDSCSVKITGNYNDKVVAGKYYGETL